MYDQIGKEEQVTSPLYTRTPLDAWGDGRKGSRVRTMPLSKSTSTGCPRTMDYSLWQLGKDTSPRLWPEELIDDITGWFDDLRGGFCGVVGWKNPWIIILFKDDHVATSELCPHHKALLWDFCKESTWTNGTWIPWPSIAHTVEGSPHLESQITNGHLTHTTVARHPTILTGGYLNSYVSKTVVPQCVPREAIDSFSAGRSLLDQA